MIELVHILRTLSDRGIRQVDLKELEEFLLDLWDSERISIYSTFDILYEDLQRLAEIGVVRYDGRTVVINEGFMQKTELMKRMTMGLIAGNAYLTYIFDVLKRRAEEFADKLAQKGAEAIAP
jgi:uncharacterized protein YlzI (FlbEa/FlbD family)